MHQPPLTGAETDRKQSDWDMRWREPKAPICSDTGKPVPWLGYSACTRNAPKLLITQQAGGKGKQGRGIWQLSRMLR